MDVDLNKMVDKLKPDECWDELVIKRFDYSGKVDFSVGRRSCRKGQNNRTYELLSHSEPSFMPAWVKAKRDVRDRIREKKIVFAVVKFTPSFKDERDQVLVGVLVPTNWLLHEFRCDVKTEGNHAR